MYWSALVLAQLAALCLCTPTWRQSTDAPLKLGLRGPQHTQLQSVSARATWIWESEMIADSSDVSEFLSFAQANNVAQVFVQVNPDIGNGVWENFIGQCNANGITVDALMGNSQWVVGGGTPSLQSQLDWIEQFQTVATSGGRFAGIHMDVEPWGLADWETNKAAYIQGWEGVAQNIASLARSLGITVAADLPFWANTLTSTTQTETVDIWMLNLLDYAVFMTYRNTAAGVKDLAVPILAAGDATGTPVWLAVETTFEDDLLSYWGQSASKLQSDLADIAASSEAHASFGGIAVHDYHGWSAMK